MCNCNNDDDGNDNDDNDNDKTSDSDDDDMMTMETPLLLLSSNTNHPIQIVEKQERPPTGFTWNANAIIECLAVSLDAYDQSVSSQLDEWKPPPDHVRDWKPQPVPLPDWAMPTLVSHEYVINNK